MAEAPAVVAVTAAVHLPVVVVFFILFYDRVSRSFFPSVRVPSTAADCPSRTGAVVSRVPERRHRGGYEKTE